MVLFSSTINSRQSSPTKRGVSSCFVGKCYNKFMFAQLLIDIFILLGLATCGWFVTKKLRVPAPEIIGPLIFVDGLRALGVNLPDLPDFLFNGAQLLIGVFVGTMITRETVKEVREIGLPALIIVGFALVATVLIGYILYLVTAIDPFTALLAASLGSLTEITVLALASGSNLAIVITMQMIRVLFTVLIYPYALKRMDDKEKSENRRQNEPFYESNITVDDSLALNTAVEDSLPSNTSSLNLIQKTFNRKNLNLLLTFISGSWYKLLITFIAAIIGGILFEIIGIPAGLMIGSMFMVAAVSLAGAPIMKFPSWVLSVLLILIGVSVADNMSPQTFVVMADPALLFPMIIGTAVVFAASFGITAIIYRISGWDYPTSFMAAAPGGFSMITALAIKQNRNPFKVSIIHVSRLISLKLLLPIVLLYLQNFASY